MAHSIETRLPFLEKDFVDYCYSIPVEKKLKGGWSKALLREYMKEKMNSEIVYRKNKLGFSTPDSIWIKFLGDDIEELFKDDLLSENYINSNWIKKNFKNNKFAELIIKFYIVENWMRIFQAYRVD
jgi:asparagine synthase (glutamine-hydrolysing)